MAEPIIEARDVVKVYETGELTVRALQGVNITIAPGEMVAVMGPSGCGKTTLLNTFSGIDTITSGDVLVAGRALNEMSDRERTRYRSQNMGFVFQSFNLLPVLSGVENVELPLLLSGVQQQEARARALELMELVGIVEQANKRPAEMSGGQQQRTTIARALAPQPAIVWADEPTGSLDSETSREIMDVLCKLNDEQAQTFVLVTHDPAVGERATRMVRMRDGLIESDAAQERAAAHGLTNPDA